MKPSKPFHDLRNIRRWVGKYIRQLNLYRRQFFKKQNIYFLVATTLLMGANTPTQGQLRADEATLKAAILVNMVMFVDWPPSRWQTPYVQLCYIENTPVTTALEKIKDKEIRGKKFRVTQVSLSNLSECHILVTPSDTTMLPEIMKRLDQSPILLIGDNPDLFGKGVMLNLALEDNHIVFDFDLAQANKNHLQISSKALRLARNVIAP